MPIADHYDNQLSNINVGSPSKALDYPENARMNVHISQTVWRSMRGMKLCTQNGQFQYLIII